MTIQLGLTLCYIGNFEKGIIYLSSQLDKALRNNFVLKVLLTTEGMMLILAGKGEYNRAAELFGLLDSHPVGFPEMNKIYPPIVELVARLKAELGDAAYEVAYERGKSHDLETIAKQLSDEFGKEQ